MITDRISLIPKKAFVKRAKRTIGAVSLLFTMFMVTSCMFDVSVDIETLAEERLNREQYQDRVYLSGGGTVAILSDGTVFSSGHYQEIQEITPTWTDIVQVSSPDSQDIIGLKEDGTTIWAGRKEGSIFNVKWEGITQLASNRGALYGLREDGTVVAVGENNSWGRLEVESWENVKKLYSTHSSVVYALTHDGCVLASNQELERSGASSWVNVVDVSYSHEGKVIALKEDGSVYSENYSAEHAASIDSWTDIVAIATGSRQQVAAGLRADGTVVFTANLDSFQPEVNGKPNYYDQSFAEIPTWKNVVAIEADDAFIVGLTYEGDVLFAGRKGHQRAKNLDFTVFEDIVAAYARTSSVLLLDRNGTLDGYSSPIHRSSYKCPPLW